MKLKAQTMYRMLSVVFALLGVLTFLNVAAAWNMEGVFLWRAAAYSAINFLIAYGLYTQARWVLAAFVVNLLGNAFLILGISTMYGDAGIPTSSIIGLGIMAILVIFLYETRNNLRKISHEYPIGGAFAALWLCTFAYSTLLALS